MSASPRNYVASILAGENRVKELHALAPSRAQRIARALAARSGRARTTRDLAAVGWACEMTALEAAAEAMPDRHIAWLDFDAHARRHAAGDLTRIAAFFGFAADDATARRDRRRPADAPLFEGARI